MKRHKGDGKVIYKRWCFIVFCLVDNDDDDIELIAQSIRIIRRKVMMSTI